MTADPSVEELDVLVVGAGYVQRSLADLPQQGPEAPWVMSMSYHDDRRLLRSGDVTDEHLHFSGAAERARKKFTSRVDRASALSMCSQEEPPGHLIGTRSAP